MPENTIETLKSSLIGLDAHAAVLAARNGLASGVEPLDMINRGIRVALDAIGRKFAEGELFLPELLMAAKAAEEAVTVLEPELTKRGEKETKQGKVLMVTVQGDLHDIGKNIVRTLLKSAGFEVVDLGVDKSGEEILAAAQEHGVFLIGLSALLTTTMPRMKEFINLLDEKGLRDQFRVIVGGAPITADFAREIGADGYSSDAARAVDLAKEMFRA